MKNNKKGQVTFFIIAGIVILIIFLLVFILRMTTTVFTPDRVVPPEMEPLDNYIKDCLETNAREAITLVGINGGYIRFPPEIANDPNSYISTNPLFKDIKVPLWRYRGQTRIPSESRMTADIEWYLQENVPTCLGEFGAFNSLFEIVEKEDMTIDVELLSKGVSVEMDYPLEVKNRGSGQVTLLNNFRATIPTRLKTTYELAKKIMITENNDLFIERRALDLIAMDVDIPYTDVAFDCSPRTWKVSEVKEKFSDLIGVNLPRIKVDRTDYIPISDDFPYEQNHNVWKVTEDKYPSTGVSFSYDKDWPLFMHVSPSRGDTLIAKPTRGFDVMSFLCMNIWHFTYDVRFPVMATVKDHETANYDDYTFNFAFDAGINHNMPDTSNFNIRDFDYATEGEEEFCNSVEQNVLTVHTFENISRDGYEDHIELPGVDLTFICMKMKCPIGESEVQFRGADVYSVSEVPYCIEGILKGEKEGYLPVEKFISTTADTEADLFLTPITSKEVEVVAHEMLSTGSIYDEEPLDNMSSAIITISRGGFKSSAMYPLQANLSDDSYFDIDMSQLELLAKEDYTYDLTIYMIDDSNSLLGGYKINWTPSWSELESADKIKFHVLQMPFTTDQEKIVNFMMNMEDSSKQIPRPELI